MSFEYDTTSKFMVETFPMHLPQFLGCQPTKVQIADGDLSTTSGSTDKALKIFSLLGDWIQHYEFQSGPDGAIVLRLKRGNAILAKRHQLPVESILVLLSPKANSPSLTGVYKNTLPGQNKPNVSFRYRVVRVYKLPVDKILKAGLGVLPFAPISNVKKDDLPRVIEEMDKRVKAEAANRKTESDLWQATNLLLGLRYEVDFVGQLLKGITVMRESTTYQAILSEGEAKGIEKGRLEEARQILLRQAEARFGKKPNKAIRETIEAVSDREKVEDLLARVHQVNSWKDLLPIR